jgi:hypothetical protein
MNEQRESRYIKVARIAYAIAQETVPRYSHPKSPHRFTQPQLVACLLLTFYLDISYRDMEEWLLASAAVQRVLELKHIPDHSTLSRVLKRVRMSDMQAMKARLLAGMDKEEVVAADATSFRFSQASAYYQTRSGRTYQDWLKGGYVVGTRSLMILGWRSGSGTQPDFDFLAPLKRQVTPYGLHVNGQRAWMLLADSGLDARGVSRLDLIPPIRRNGKLTDPRRKARADLVAAARLDGLFGQRWKAETVNSVIKRKFGDTIRSRSPRLQHREPLLKGLVYNIHV